ncbi:procollagen-proline 4-dioxygenase [Aureococcus anophagefferens]|nr:procollagen-proline 4-dioxygenase [Aureococcus anophagefferens]
MLEYATPRRLLVCGKNGALVREDSDPNSDSQIVATLERFEAAVAVGELRVGGKTRLQLTSPVSGWASASVFVEREDVISRRLGGDAAPRRGAQRRGPPRALRGPVDGPLAFCVRDFATGAECDRIIAEATPRLSASSPAAAGEQAGSSRSAQVAWVPRSPDDPWLARRVAELIDVPLSQRSRSRS